MQIWARLASWGWRDGSQQRHSRQRQEIERQEACEPWVWAESVGWVREMQLSPPVVYEAKLRVGQKQWSSEEEFSETPKQQRVSQREARQAWPEETFPEWTLPAVTLLAVVMQPLGEAWPQ